MWIRKLWGKLFGDKTVTHIEITEDLMMLVLDKLLEFGSDTKDWSFASSRGQTALAEVSSSSAAMQESIHRVDFPTSVLTWHIATDMLYRLDNQAEKHGEGSDPVNKEMEMAMMLSNYIMYLIFECRVMLTTNSKLMRKTTKGEMEKDLPSNEAIRIVHDEANKGQHHPANNNSASSSGPTQLQLLKNSIEALHSRVPCARAVADELAAIPGGRRWGLISAVWLEMLYYITPRCGGDFHAEHLSTGGEFVTHVLVLMHQLGPFIPPPGA
jgi:hypothetical protein